MHRMGRGRRLMATGMRVVMATATGRQPRAMAVTARRGYGRSRRHRGPSSAFRTMCLVRTSELLEPRRRPRGRARHRRPDRRRGPGITVGSTGPADLAARATAAPAMVPRSAGHRRGAVRPAVRCVRTCITRAEAEGRGSCGVAARRAVRRSAWLRRCDRAGCCRTGRPSASRHRAPAGRTHRTARSR